MIEIGKESQKSQVVKRTTGNPKFENERFLIPVDPDQLPPLNIHVWDWHLIHKDEYIGSCSLKIDNIQRDVPNKLDLTLTSCATPNATVTIIITAHNFGASQDAMIPNQIQKRDSIVEQVCSYY